MEGPCYGNGEDYGREQLEKHEKEVWRLVQRYESGEEEVDLEAVKAWFERPRHKEWRGLGDDYVPPKVGAAMLYKTGAYKMSVVEFLTKGLK